MTNTALARLPRQTRTGQPAAPVPEAVTIRSITHRVRLELDGAPPITGLAGRTCTPRGLRLDYTHSPERDQVHVEVEYEHHAEALPPPYQPEWVRALTELHRTSPDLRPIGERKPDPEPMERPAYPPPTPGPLGEMVAQHMARFDEQTGGDYEVAVDHRDDTAVVVWRPGMFGSMAGVRGTMLWRWLCSLRDAGFTAQPRTDMEVFGKPDEEADIAWWLHVTDWADPTPPCCRERLTGQDSASSESPTGGAL